MTNPILRLFFLVTPHFDDAIRFEPSLSVRREVLDVVKPHAYSVEVPYGSYQTQAQRQAAEKSFNLFALGLQVNDFVKADAKNAFDNQIPVKIFEEPPTLLEKRRILDLASGVLKKGDVQFSEKELPFTLRQRELMLASSPPRNIREEQGRAQAFHELVLELKKRAYSGSGLARTASIEALNYVGFVAQDKVVRKLLDAKNYAFHPGEREVRVAAGLGVYHESVLKTLSRHIAEGRLKGFSKVVPHFVFMDQHGNVATDLKTRELMGEEFVRKYRVGKALRKNYSMLEKASRPIVLSQGLTLSERIALKRKEKEARRTRLAKSYFVPGYDVQKRFLGFEREKQREFPSRVRRFVNRVKRRVVGR